MTSSAKKIRLNPWALAILSGALFFLSYPPFSFFWLAWAAPLPLFEAVRSAASKRKSFALGLVTGLVFFLVSLQWLTHVTGFGWFALSCLEALFIGFFGIVYFQKSKWKGMSAKILWTAAGWTALEWARAHLPVFGFGWNLLGYSQSFSPVIAQSANLAGVYGVSFVMMAAIVLFDEMIFSFRSGFRKASAAAGIALLALIAGIFSHGFYYLSQPGKSAGTWRLSLIQGNIPQAIKWEPMARDEIVAIYTKLTELAAFDKPDLILWPEAAFPGYFNRDYDAESIRELAAKLETPILLGSPHYGNLQEAFNSAYLVGADGHILERYDKQKLVPFGEYMPMKWLLGWLAPFAYSMGVSDFSAGHEPTIFELMNGEIRFSVLICFEDTFPDLARDFVEKGAAFLAVITNDGWFGHTGAPAQHLQASILRAVENGVPVVRAANTGISAIIDFRGRVLSRVEDPKTKDPLMVTGEVTYPLQVQQAVTFYRRGGWVFPYVNLGLFLMMALYATVRHEKQK